MDGGDRLVNPEVGGDPSLFPMGPPKILCYGEALIDLIAENPMVLPRPWLCTIGFRV
jgi:hypothetical protein